MSIIASGKISKDGKVHIVNRDRFWSQVIDRFSGRSVEFVCRPKRKTVSNPQRAYYFGAMLPALVTAFSDAGMRWDTKRIDWFLRERFLYEFDINEKTGEQIKRVLSLSDDAAEVTTTRMMAYFDDVLKFAAEDLYFNELELPNEQSMFNFVTD